MSHTKLKIVQPDGDIVSGQSFSNAHGFAMFVWNRLIERYHVPGPYMSFRDGEKDRYDNLWHGVAHDSYGIEPWEFNVLVSTYDRVLINREDWPLLVASYRRFNKHYNNGKWGCHMLPIADAVEKLMENGDEAQAIGFHAMSVSEDLFGDVLIECTCGKPDIDCTCEEYRPYNVNRDKGHWYAELRPLE